MFILFKDCNTQLKIPTERILCGQELNHLIDWFSLFELIATGNYIRMVMDSSVEYSLFAMHYTLDNKLYFIHLNLEYFKNMGVELKIIQDSQELDIYTIHNTLRILGNDNKLSIGNYLIYNDGQGINIKLNYAKDFNYNKDKIIICKDLILN